MIKLGLIEDDILLNAGAALFVDCGINELQMAKFASDERLTFTDIRRFTGSILDLSDKAVQYVIDAMDWRVEFDGSLERKEIPEIPVDAVREAVINAFAHRLIESGQSVEVAVYRSFIEIYSPGKFPDGMTPEMFIKDIRKPIRRNPLITRTLYYSKDMKSFATGMKRIQDACDEAGCKVEYYGDEYGFTVRFYRHCGEGWGTDMGAKTTGSKVPNVTLDVTLGVTLENPVEASVFELIRENASITIPQMAEKLSINGRTVQRATNSLKVKGIIERKGGKRYGYWDVKN